MAQKTNNPKQAEIELIEKLFAMDGYFAAAFTRAAFTRADVTMMECNINADYDLLCRTTRDESSTKSTKSSTRQPTRSSASRCRSSAATFSSARNPHRNRDRASSSPWRNTKTNKLTEGLRALHQKPYKAMEIIKHTSGKAIGQISVRNTIATMERGEEWTAEPGDIKLGYAQVCCSQYGAETGKQFHVSSPKEANGRITIKRIN